MSVLSTAAQQQVEDALVSEGALTAEQLAALKEKASKENAPLLSLFVSAGKVSEESLTKF